MSEKWQTERNKGYGVKATLKQKGAYDEEHTRWHQSNRLCQDFDTTGAQK
jgi:hypothetical protein